MFSFEYSVTKCGEPKNNRRRNHNGPFPGGVRRSAYTDCQGGYANNNGIDIVFADTVAIELKRSGGVGSGSSSQLQAYCRFSARKGVHATIYGYLTMPSDTTLNRMAKACWKCWDNPFGKSCPNRRSWNESVGSVLVVFATNNGKKRGGGIWIPGPNICGK